jgi:hypothetical protein
VEDELKLFAVKAMGIIRGLLSTQKAPHRDLDKIYLNPKAGISTLLSEIS